MKKNIKILSVIIIIIGLSLAAEVSAGLWSDFFSRLFGEEPQFGAPSQTYQKTILPITDSIYNLGAEGNEWLYGWFDRLKVGNSTTTNATTTHLGIIGLGGGAGDLKIAADGSVYEGTDATGGGGGTGSNWSYINEAIDYLTPSTTVGFIVSASSTIASNFRVDGNVTTTKALSVGSNALVVRDDGNVGIGTAEPVRPLHIQGADTFLRADRIGASYGASWLLTRMSNSSTVASSWLFGPANVASASGDDFTIVDYGTAIEGTSGKV